MQTVEQIKAAYEAAGGQAYGEGRFVVSSCTLKEGRNGEFATVELRDPSGSLLARCFDAPGIEVLRTAGTVEARLKVDTYNNSMSAIVQSASAIELSKEEVMRYAGLNPEAHDKRVELVAAWVRECAGTVYGDVLRAAFAEPGVWDSFCMAPAAVRMHHAEPGGLVRHVCEVGMAGLAMLESTGKAFDRPYFLAGVLLHDIGKLDTYTMPPTIAYTAQGQLAEHQIYSTFRLAKACAKVGAPASIEARLIHIIEQAHGAFRHAEWQDPLGVEVKALAAADFFSSRLGTTDKEDRAQKALDELIAADAAVARQVADGPGEQVESLAERSATHDSPGLF